MYVFDGLVIRLRYRSIDNYSPVEADWVVKID